jgi:Flp pilus assembly protein TadG
MATPVAHSLARFLKCEQAASLAEFAISLPLLVVLVVGIFDFGGAFNVKQEVNNAAREGARFGAAQPTNDLCGAGNPCTPASVEAIRVLIASYLQAARLNDCGLGAMTGPNNGNTDPAWSYQTTGTCSGQLTLTIIRGYPQCNLTTTYGNQGPTVNIPCTEVSLSYPYAWHFNNVIQLVAPGSSLALSTIPTNATAMNMN